jgi:hypothetical protein
MPAPYAPGPTHLVYQPEVVALDAPPHRTPGHKALGRGLQVCPPLNGLILQSPRAQQHLQGGGVRRRQTQCISKQAGKAGSWIGACRQAGWQAGAALGRESRPTAAQYQRVPHLDIAVCRANGVVPQLPGQLVVVPDGRHVLHPGTQRVGQGWGGSSENGAHMQGSRAGRENRLHAGPGVRVCRSAVP